MTKVTIAIIHFGDISITRDCLDSLAKLDHSDVEIKILVINNDLRVEFPDIKHTGSIHVETINNRKNIGFSGGHNQGFDFAVKNKSDFHIVLNNDTSVDKGLVKELVRCFERNKKAGIVSPKIYFSKGSEFHKKRYSENDLGKVIWYAGGIIDWKNLINQHKGVDEVDGGQYDVEVETDFATGACFMIPTDVIKSVGKFDNRYFLYYEDGDLNMRIKDSGFKIMFCPKALIWHRNAASSSSGSSLQDYYISRNRLLFGFTYASLRTKAALVRESLRILLSGRKWQKSGVRDFYLKKFGKGSYSI